MAYDTIQVKPLTPVLGAEITDIDLTATLSNFRILGRDDAVLTGSGNAANDCLVGRTARVLLPASRGRGFLPRLARWLF